MTGQRYINKSVNGGDVLFLVNSPGFGLFGTWNKIFLLTIITLGIYGLWAFIVVQKWIVSHTEFSA